MYRDTATKADVSGEFDQARVYRLIAAICDLHFKPEDKSEPYGPMMVMANGIRTPNGTDFAGLQALALAECLDRLENVALRTRIADIIWLNDRSNAVAGTIAVDGYLKLLEWIIDASAIDRLSKPDPGCPQSIDFVKRAATIARALGSHKAPYEAVKAMVERLYKATLTGDVRNFDRAINLAMSFAVLSGESAHRLVESKVVEVQGVCDTFEEEELRKTLIDAAVYAKDDTLANKARVSLSQFYERRASTQHGNAVLECHALEQAISALDNARGVREQRSRLQIKLTAAQTNYSEELFSVSETVDLSDIITQTRAHFEGRDFDVPPEIAASLS